MDTKKKMPFAASKCRICLGEYDDSTMQELFKDNEYGERDLVEIDEDDNEENVDDKEYLNVKIETCCGIKIRQALYLPSKACERCCEFVRMWFSFREMCLNSQVYLESSHIKDEKPNEMIDASDSEYMEYLYESLQVQTPGLYNRFEEVESAGSPEIDSDYIVHYDEEHFVADSLPVEEQNNSSKNDLQEILSELETYEAEDGEPIEVEPSLMYVDNSQTVDDIISPKIEDCEINNGDEDEDFLSPTPSPDPKPAMPAKRRPGRPRKTDSDLKTKRKVKDDTNSKIQRQNEPEQSTKYVCNLCGNAYPKKAAFTAHMMAHTNYKPHQCEICCKSFRQMGELRAHIRRHTGERPYKCLYCDRHFYDRSEKVRHERVHTNTRPYECKECGKTFTHTAILKNHSLVHSGEKNFNCNICSKSFTLLHQLKAHLQTLTHRSKEEQALASSSNFMMGDENLE